MKKWIHANTSIFQFRDYLPEDVLGRLADCKSRKSDIPYLANARYNYLVKTGRPEDAATKEEALDYVNEHIASNNQLDLCDYIIENYDRLLKRIHM